MHCMLYISEIPIERERKREESNRRFQMFSLTLEALLWRQRIEIVRIGLDVGLIF